MTPRFQADADFNQKIVLGLRRREPAVDFHDAHEGGVIGAPDLEVLRIAAESGRVLVSHDRKTMPAHFARFLESRSSPGVIIVAQDRRRSRRFAADLGGFRSGRMARSTRLRARVILARRPSQAAGWNLTFISPARTARFSWRYCSHCDFLHPASASRNCISCRRW